MKLEAIDPLNLSAVCAATVMQILNEGYMMIRIDCYPADASGADWFCYHQRSPCIFPVGFASANNIPLVPPQGYVYCSKTLDVIESPTHYYFNKNNLHGHYLLKMDQSIVD